MPQAAPQPEAVLEVVEPGGSRRLVPVTQCPFLIGRGSETGNHLQLPDKRISRECAALAYADRGFRLEDRGQRHGLYVNGQKTTSHQLSDGDTISFGISDSYELIFHSGASLESLPILLSRLDHITTTEPGPRGLRKLSLLLEATALLQSHLPLDSVLGTMVDHALALTDADRGVLLEPDAQGKLQPRVARQRGARNDHGRMEKLLECFGDNPAESITPQQIEQCFQAEPWSAATWNRYRSLVSLTYRLAIRASKVKENPARLVSHKIEHNGRVRFLTVEEERKLRAAILERFSEPLPEFDLALHTGLRLSEQYQAQWKNVDLEHRVLTIPWDKGGRTSHVRLNDAAVAALLQLRECTEQTEFVCGGTKGPRHWFEEALHAAQIANFSWHCLRHTFASRLVMAGVDLRTVAELLRDRTLHMAMRYSHLAPDFTLEAVKRMEAKFRVLTDTTAAPGQSVESARVN